MNFPIEIPDILLPNRCDRFWPVIACDQFTSQPEYWTVLEKEIGNAPSTLRMVFPEAFLGENDGQRIENIRKSAQKYDKQGIFAPARHGMILVDRKTPYHEHRLGLIVAVDLEAYSYKALDKAPVRATEATILERIPPRVAIREKMDVEFPHVMLLLNDEKRTIIEKLYLERDSFDKVYDVDLLGDGGHVTGYFLGEERSKQVILDLEKTVEKSEMLRKYGEENVFLCAVGDGNHSLATAKTCWENLKKKLSANEIASHPARYALCELVNIYDDGLQFEPIHRLVTGVDVQDFCSQFQTGSDAVCRMVTAQEARNVAVGDNLVSSILTLDKTVEEYLKTHGGKVDYIHGDDEVVALAKEHGGVAFLLPKMEKEDLFVWVNKYGNLPKKTFSMGHAVEKRYYLEGRKITPNNK